MTLINAINDVCNIKNKCDGKIAAAINDDRIGNGLPNDINNNSNNDDCIDDVVSSTTIAINTINNVNNINNNHNDAIAAASTMMEWQQSCK